MKTKFNTSVDDEILQEFKKKCKEDGFSVSFIIEQFMKSYNDKSITFDLKFSNNGK